MTWVRIDDAMPEHPKVLAAGPLAFALDVAAICYSARNGTNGRIPRAKVRLLLDLSDVRIGRAKVDPIALAEKLVECGRWHRDGDDYVIHDFAEYNFTREETEDRALELREKRRAAGRLGGLRRAQGARSNGEANADPVASKTEANVKQNRSKPEANDEANAKQTPSKTEAPIPIPIPVSNNNNTPPTPPEGEAKADDALAADTVEAARGPIEAELRKHRTFDALDVAAVAQALAERYLTRAVSRGAKLEWVLTAIADCAADKAGAGLSAEALGKALRAYVDRARAPTPTGEGQARQFGQPRPARGAPLIQQDRQPPKWLQGKEF